MKIVHAENIKSRKPIKVLDCFVDKGYLQGPGGSLPDVDIDFQSDRRQDVKEYTERRYNHDNKQRVFSAGTFTTLKTKACIKDVARTMRIPVSLVNYITAIIDDDKCDYSGLFKLAVSEKKIAKFIHDYPQLFEDIRTLLFQPRSSSVHASALLITPDEKDGVDMECFDYVPIKKIDGILVSEFDGYSLDELGLLKNDVLATKELSKLHEVFDLVERHYDTKVSLESIVMGQMDDPKVYDLLSKGYTQNVFQFSSKGMTKFLISMRPENINDLIAANALFRPATLESGSTEAYVNCKIGLVAPVYLWGTYNAMKDTYGVLCYQEQLSQIAREVGGFSLAEGVKLVKFISKKKQDKIDAMRETFMISSNKNGCPKEDAEAIWTMFEVAGSYIFNKSHATAYAATAYAGAWLKANYPLAFYTVALQWAEDKEMISIMGEMEACSNAKVVAPDINKSDLIFYTDYDTNQIFWSLSKIKMLGAKASEWIINERNKNGDYTSIENFIDRVFKYKLKKYEYWDDPDNEDEVQRCPVNARHIRNLIFAGCFDKAENVQSIIERYTIMDKAANRLGFELAEKDFPLDMIGKHYWWSQQQIKVSGMGSIDYKRIYDNSEAKREIGKRSSYVSLQDIAPFEMEDKKVTICATVVDLEEKQYNDRKTMEKKTYCKMTLQQNNDSCECLVWSEEYADFRHQLINAKNKLIVCSAVIKYSDFIGRNNLQFYRRSILEVL